ncbi:serine dehydratase beta chain [Atopobacter phocae]|uniref:serine dehydratase beta chain n=1 Tax=Atopobacter phocae TaxID=136492 RepID=UPI0004AD334D|nr:serine dehydratase beta chain [Atopobacter phocae]
MSKSINYRSCFDIIGPIMVGPSSSHTAGALRIALAARCLLQGTPERVICRYYESFAETHQGHGTDYAIVGGVLNFSTEDTRVPHAIEIAQDQGIDIQFIERKNEESPIHHENTADVELISGAERVRLIGASVGGGTIEVRHYEVEDFVIQPTGPLPIVIAISEDNKKIEQVKHLLQDLDLPVTHRIVQEKNQKVLTHFELNAFLTNEKEQRLRELKTDDLSIYILK